MNAKGLFRGTIHWTAGGLKANALDKKHYHVIVEADGTVVLGNHTPEDNINCYDGSYAAHNGYNNTGNIGISMCGAHAGFIHGEVTAIAFERAAEQAAIFSKKYNISVNEWKTHWEYDQALPRSKRSGKTDLSNLSFLPGKSPKEIADIFRGKVKWYLHRLNNPPVPLPDDFVSPVPDDGKGDKLPDVCPTCGQVITKER